MAFDASFFALVGLVLFFVLIAYLKVPGMLSKSLDERAQNIQDELAEAKRLREEAQHLLAEYQRKRKEAEAEAAGIVAAAEREAAALTEEAKQKTEEFVARRTALSEQKIKQAEEDAIGAVRAAAVDIAIAASEKLLAEKTTAAAKAKLACRGEPDREKCCDTGPELGEIRIFGALAFEEGEGTQHQDHAEAERHGDFRGVACSDGR